MNEKMASNDLKKGAKDMTVVVTCACFSCGGPKFDS